VMMQRKNNAITYKYLHNAPMLAADKLQLQSSLKQKATALKEKEFQLHHSNLMTVGTQAAVLAGLDVTMLIEFQPLHDSEWATVYWVPRLLKLLYYITIVAAFCANITVVSQTTLLSLLSGGLSLRGPDGSMITATDGLYEERKIVFKAFGIGLVCTVIAVVIAVWLILPPESALICSSISISTAFFMYTQYLRVVKRFYFDESQTVDFTDIFDGPANVSSNNRDTAFRSSRPTSHLPDCQNLVLGNGECHQHSQMPNNSGRRRLIQPREDAFHSDQKPLVTV